MVVFRRGCLVASVHGCCCSMLCVVQTTGAVKRLPSLGRTPAGDRPPNLGHLLGWLQGIPLAASAAKDPYHHHNDHLQRYAAELQGPFGVGY